MLVERMIVLALIGRNENDLQEFLKKFHQDVVNREIIPVKRQSRKNTCNAARMKESNKKNRYPFS